MITRLKILIGWRPVVICIIAMLAGCASRVAQIPIGSTVQTIANNPVASGSLLPWLGGISILGGVIALILTRRQMGWSGIVVGVLLVILNDAMQRFALAFYVPILVGSAGVSLAYAWRLIRRAIIKRKGK